MLERALTDWPLKLLALVVAFGIWVSITGEDHSVRDFTVPVELRLREDRICVTPPPTTVAVRLEGPDSAIRKLDPLDLAVRLDLGDAPLGEREVQFSEPHLNGVPQGVQVSFFDPDRIRLSVDRRSRREIKVVPDVVGEPPAGFAFYGAFVYPETIVVEGPESALGSLAELRTEPIPLNHRTRAFVEIVGAVTDAPQVRAAEPRSLKVQVVVDAAPVEITFNGIPVEVAGGTPEAEPNPPHLKVTLSGPPGLLQNLTRTQIRAVADVARHPSGRVPVRAGLVDLSLEQSRRVSVKSVEPGQVSVQLQPRNRKS